MRRLLIYTIFVFHLCVALTVQGKDAAPQEIPGAAVIAGRLNDVKTTPENPSDNAELKMLEETRALLKEIEEQKRLNSALDKEIAGADSSLAKSRANIEKYKRQSAVGFQKISASESLERLEEKLDETQTALEALQAELIEINSKVSAQNNVVARVQTLLKDNLTRMQDIGRLSENAATDTQQERYNTELALIALKDSYNQTLLQENDKLRSMYETRAEEKNLQQQMLQRRLIALQEVVNEKKLQASKQQVSQATRYQQQYASNPIIAEQLEINTALSKALLEQTAQMNSLSQDNLRIKTILDNLKQTQHYIEDQISVLQGTLILSQVINKQRQDLPKDQMVQGLPKQITNLRVQIFNNSEIRDRLTNVQDYISGLEQQQNQKFDRQVRSELTSILEERYKLMSDLIKSLNSQLNLAVNIDLNQQQVLSISDALQVKLQQQSFWVQSNDAIDIEWIKSFPGQALREFKELSKNVDFSQVSRHLFVIIAIGVVLIFAYLLIMWEKARIKARLEVLAAYVNTLKNDSHWHTPEALFWTVILALPNTIIFFAVVSFAANILFTNKTVMWQISLILSVHWLFFSTVLALLRPHGIAYLHFGMEPRSNEVFRSAVKKSITMFVLFVISFGFSYLESVDYSNDVIGEVISLIALILCQFVILPLFNKAIRRYEKDAIAIGETANTRWLKFLRAILVLIPISLMILIVLGYYYTANVLIKHLLNCYLLVIAWFFARHVVYRIFTVSSRRMAYRRLQEKREQIRLQGQHDEKAKELEAEEKSAVKISTVNKQLFQIADFVGWIILLFCFYLIWSDLISVAYYLDGVILWKSGEGGNVETITLLNLMRSLVVLVVTYAIIRNLDGILEVLIFSRGRFKRGVSHTITAILRYIAIIIGSIWAFSNLGLSWMKIQWIFTALSVGLGFGVREIFGSFVSGLILLFERPVRVGDKVTVGQYTGTVTQIRLRSTTLIDSDDKDVVLPNQAFVTDRFINWTLSNTMTRVVVPVNVAYSSDVDMVVRLLRQVADETPNVVQDQPINVNFLGFGKSALEFELQLHVPELDDRTPATNFINYRINQLFGLNDIKIAVERLDVQLQQSAQSASPVET